MISSRRIPMLAAVLALAALAAPAALAKPASNCPAGSEPAGCKLPVNATYSKQVKTGSAEGTVSAGVYSGGISVSIYNAYIDCKKFDPSNGNQAGIAAHFKGKQRPAVGKTYTIQASESENSEEGGSSSAEAELTLKFTSAKVMTLTLHEVLMSEGKLMCDGGASWTLRRQATG